MALKAAVQLFKDQLADICPTGQFHSLAADGDAVLAIFADVDGKSLRLNLTYLEPGSYPRSGCLVLLEDQENRYAERISSLSERFQDSAALATVLSKVADILDIPINEEALRAVEGNQHAGQAEGMEEDVSEEAMSEDGSGYAGSGSDYDGDDHSGDEQDDDKELLIECGQRQGRWARYEEELERAHATQQALSMDQGKASKQQIFSSQEAFKMLSNELLGFIRRQFQGTAEVSADSVGDDVFTWNVEIWRSAFKPDCPLAKDMAEVSTKWAVSSVQLRFSFMRGLHPFYPPTLEVVRPHLSCPLPGALASHPLLRLEHWDPMMNMSQLLDRIKEFLEEFGHVDLDHPRNSHPVSALTPVQTALARLEALTDVRPACYASFLQLYEARSTRGRSDSPVDVLQQMKKQRTDDKDENPAAPQAVAANPVKALSPTGLGPAGHLPHGQVAWAKGVGYGYGSKSGPVWDAKAAQAAQEAQDEQLCGLLQGLAAALTQETAGSPTGTAAEPNKTSAQLAPADAAEPMDGGLTPQQQECLQSVQNSVLLPLLAREFGNVAFPEMVSRHQYYRPLLSVLLALCRPATEQLLAANIHAGEQLAAAAGGAGSSSGQQVQSIAGALRGLARGATMYRERMAKVLEQQLQEAAGSSSAASAAGTVSAPKKVNKETEALVQEAQRSMAIADMLLETTNKLQHLSTAEDAAATAEQPGVTAAVTTAAAAQRGPRTRRATSRSAGAAAADADQAAEGETQSAYPAALKPLVLDNAKISNRHKFGSEAARDPMGLKQRMQKVTSEMAGVERLIDVNESSSIFVRIDEDNVFLWKALITGPDDTPYSNGCFIFDFFFPPEYPGVPPKVVIITTGGGLVRFNPNLYNCGKVCLSLLGTWSGGQGEGWDPNVSTALQVLLSIQSLILVEKPYYNEPGFEQRSHEPQSKEYNKNIREATMKWAMVDQLKNPPPEFADVIRTHFRLRAPYIRKQVQAWIAEAGQGAHADRLKALQTQLEQELAKLV